MPWRQSGVAVRICWYESRLDWAHFICEAEQAHTQGRPGEYSRGPPPGGRQNNRRLGRLNTMIMLTPLLRSFGTVPGSIESFQRLGDAALVALVEVSGGLAHALITSALGRGVAMPGLIACKLFHSQAEKFRCERATPACKRALSPGLAGNTQDRRVKPAVAQ